MFMLLHGASVFLEVKGGKAMKKIGDEKLTAER
jgi:hypothetical protein